MKVCPNIALHPTLDQAGLEGLWTPVLVPRIGYCEPSCVMCSEVCPTGAIWQITPKEKGWVVGVGQQSQPIRLGTAFYDRGRCLPWAMAIGLAELSAAAVPGKGAGALPVAAFRAGATIYSVGDPPGGMYGLVSGKFAISIAPGERGAHIAHFARSGTWFGEAAAFTEQPRRIGSPMVCSEQSIGQLARSLISRLVSLWTLGRLERIQRRAGRRIRCARNHQSIKALGTQPRMTYVFGPLRAARRSRPRATLSPTVG